MSSHNVDESMESDSIERNTNDQNLTTLISLFTNVLESLKTDPRIKLDFGYLNGEISYLFVRRE